ncbi:hypothetical protein N7517_001727 [Penicillium concentricum]|uniref:HTH CENPB-type domain-containing protein n=1 Tax=Penicillium concentricum TaxID=293559 RepID=A0A9W9VL50_9EURO|nr:uncharacterized protein N7517_001727 [Penicillium concentricum]KAJ5383816.1 hypothetical protein N7517_001727 [Penicillium concentricum]
MSDQKKQTEERIQAALKAFHAINKPNIAKLAREFDVPYAVGLEVVESLDNSYTSPTPELVEKSANRLLKNAVVGHNWAYRFLQRLPPRLKYLIRKPKEKYNNLSRVIEEHQFLPHEIYNWDETGYRISQGKPRKVITSHTTNDIATGGQSESITGIECIAADG